MAAEAFDMYASLAVEMLAGTVSEEQCGAVGIGTGLRPAVGLKGVGGCAGLAGAEVVLAQARYGLQAMLCVCQ